MKYIKLVIISFVFLFLFITIISLFMPSQVQISKIMNMDSEPDSLWQVVDNFKTWDQWNTILPDLSMQNPEYSGHYLRTEKIKVSWQRKQPGLQVAKIERKNGKPLLTGWKAAKDNRTDSLRVQWYIDIHLRWYPWEKFAGMLYEKSYGDKLEDGLKKLKQILEE